MTVEIRYWDDGGIHFKGSADVDGNECLKANAALYEDEQSAKNICYQIVDLLEAESYNVTPEQHRLLSEQDEAVMKINPSMIVAIVADNKLIYGLNRMYQSYLMGNGENVRLFNTMEDAQSWIQSCIKKQ